MLDLSGLSATITRRFRGRVHRSDLGVPHGPHLGWLLSLRLSFEGKCHRWVNRFDPQVCPPGTSDHEKLQVSEVQIRRSLYLEAATSRPVVTSQLAVTALVTVRQASAPPPGPPGRITDYNIAAPQPRSNLHHRMRAPVASSLNDYDQGPPAPPQTPATPPKERHAHQPHGSLSFSPSRRSTAPRGPDTPPRAGREHAEPGVRGLPPKTPASELPVDKLMLKPRSARTLVRT